jgi:hypothetical protein
LTDVSHLRPQALEPFGLALQAESPGQGVRDLPVERLRALARHEGVLVLRGFAPLGGREEFQDYAAGWGDLLTWDFGAVLDLVVHDESRNYLFTNGSVPFHWDGAVGAGARPQPAGGADGGGPGGLRRHPGCPRGRGHRLPQPRPQALAALTARGEGSFEASGSAGGQPAPNVEQEQACARRARPSDARFGHGPVENGRASLNRVDEVAILASVTS